MIVIVSNDRTYLVLHSVVSPVICGLYYWPLTYTGCIWVIILNYHFHGSHYTWSGVETYLLGVSITAIIVCVKGGHFLIQLFDGVLWLAGSLTIALYLLNTHFHSLNTSLIALLNTHSAIKYLDVKEKIWELNWELKIIEQSPVCV